MVAKSESKADSIIKNSDICAKNAGKTCISFGCLMRAIGANWQRMVCSFALPVADEAKAQRVQRSVRNEPAPSGEVSAGHRKRKSPMVFGIYRGLPRPVCATPRNDTNVRNSTLNWNLFPKYYYLC